MKKKIIIFLCILLLLFILITIILIVFKKNNKNDFVFTTIEKGDLRNIISATGTIKAKGTVEIGSQVSGIVEKVYVKYNDKVTKGDILAKLDTNLLEISLEQAKAEIIKAEAQYQHTMKDFINKENLFKDKLISQYEFETARVNRDSSYASFLSAKANLLKVEANIKYAYIRSPINGIILDKNVEEGQTISSSLSAPTLFVIAENLTNLEIEAKVDESDISKIKNGTKIEFRVNAYKNITFYGSVKLIKLNPEVESNVVMYKVIIDTKNIDNLLFPGMTATIDFIIEEKKNVYLVSNSAIRFTPDENILKRLNKQKEKNFFIKENRKKEIQREKIALLWIMRDNNKIEPIPIKIGINDGQKVEIIEFESELINAKIITAIRSKTQKNKNKTNVNTRPFPMF